MSSSFQIHPHLKHAFRPPWSPSLLKFAMPEQQSHFQTARAHGMTSCSSIRLRELCLQTTTHLVESPLCHKKLLAPDFFCGLCSFEISVSYTLNFNSLLDVLNWIAYSQMLATSTMRRSWPSPLKSHSVPQTIQVLTCSCATYILRMDTVSVVDSYALTTDSGEILGLVRQPSCTKRSFPVHQYAPAFRLLANRWSFSPCWVGFYLIIALVCNMLALISQARNQI